MGVYLKFAYFLLKIFILSEWLSFYKVIVFFQALHYNKVALSAEMSNSHIQHTKEIGRVVLCTH